LLNKKREFFAFFSQQTKVFCWSKLYNANKACFFLLQNKEKPIALCFNCQCMGFVTCLDNSNNNENYLKKKKKT